MRANIVSLAIFHAHKFGENVYTIRVSIHTADQVLTHLTLFLSLIPATSVVCTIILPHNDIRFTNARIPFIACARILRKYAQSRTFTILSHCRISSRILFNAQLLLYNPNDIRWLRSKCNLQCNKQMISYVIFQRFYLQQHSHTTGSNIISHIWIRCKVITTLWEIEPFLCFVRGICWVFEQMIPFKMLMFVKFQLWLQGIAAKLSHRMNHKKKKKTRKFTWKLI